MNNSTFQFNNFSVVRSLIERKRGNVSKKLSIKFIPSGKIKKDISVFLLELGIRIKDGNDILNIEVDAVAEFSFSKNSDNDELDNYFYINAPALLFPYLRAYISTLTNLSGQETITLPTLNLTSIGEELKQNTVEE